MPASVVGHFWMGTEVEERRWIERGVWEWRIGMELERSVPLEEWMVIWTGEKRLQMMIVSIFANFGSSRILRRDWVW